MTRKTKKKNEIEKKFAEFFLNFQVLIPEIALKSSRNHLCLIKTKFSWLTLSLNKLVQVLTTLLISSKLDRTKNQKFQTGFLDTEFFLNLFYVVTVTTERALI